MESLMRSVKDLLGVSREKSKNSQPLPPVPGPSKETVALAQISRNEMKFDTKLQKPEMEAPLREQYTDVQIADMAKGGELSHESATKIVGLNRQSVSIK